MATISELLKSAVSTASPVSERVREEDLLDFHDYPKVRERLFEQVKRAVAEKARSENDRFSLSFEDVDYSGPGSFSKDQQHEAILRDLSLNRRLMGKVVLKDKATGKTLASQKRVLMNVPYLTERGTFVNNGIEYIGLKQFRLAPNVYTRVAEDGTVESQFNVAPRTGQAFRLFMDPSTSEFFMRYGGRKIPLYPVLRRMGVPDSEMQLAWGKDIWKVNAKDRIPPHAAHWLKEMDVRGQQLLGKTAAEAGQESPESLRAVFARMRLDPEVTAITLGVPHESVTPATLLQATGKILKVHRGEETSDDRDSLAFQSVHDTGDFLTDKIRQDQNRVLANALWRVTGKQGDLSNFPSGIFDKHTKHLMQVTGLMQPIEEINPIDMFNQNARVVRLGEGAISSIDAAPKEARNVQPSYLGFVDPIRSPESLRIGLDMFFARNVRKGPNNMLYTRMVDAKTGKEEWVSTRQASRGTVAFPGALESKDKFVPAIIRARETAFVPRSEVDYILPVGDDMFSTGADTVPLKSGVKGMRLLMGSKFASHALPLENRETPYVQTQMSSGETLGRKLGPYMGAAFARKPGTVTRVGKNKITVQYADGEMDDIELYRNFPLARKTSLNSEPVVETGDSFKAGDVLATSNFTDKTGQMALGTNLRVGYMPYYGKNYEDAVVISESAARKLSSPMTYHVDFDPEEDTKPGRRKFQTFFPGKYSKAQLDSVDDLGFVKPGTVVNRGDPLILAVREQPSSKSTMGRPLFTNSSEVWEHESPGVVTDVVQGRRGHTIYVQSVTPMRQADKLALPWGSKGVVAEIVPDVEMPRDEQGRALELLLSPLSIASRTNGAQLVAASLGKVAEKTGRPYVLPGFSGQDMVQFAERELEKNGLKSREDLYDPRSKKTVPRVFTGSTYVYRLQQIAETKGKARSIGGYTMDEVPARGGPEGSKHIGAMELQALLSHHVPAVLADLKLVKGQKNDAFWRQLKLGQTPSMPDTPFVYRKFKALLRSSGINLNENPAGDSIFAMTNDQVRSLTGNRKITVPETLTMDFKPISGGLFDPEATGGDSKGDRFSYIDLPEPMLNPVMEGPVRSLLGLTQKQLDDVISGQTPVEGRTGGDALKYMLQRVNLDETTRTSLEAVRTGSASKKDAALTRYGYAKAMQKQGVRPEDFMWTRVPVLPPAYRPIVRQRGLTVVTDANKCYKTLMHGIEDLREAAAMKDQTILGPARQMTYQNLKALIGLADQTNEKYRQQNVGGLLQQMFGKGSPKASFIQRRVIGTNMDLSGLAVITPNPDLKLNEVGLPENRAWDLYEPFVVRELVMRGLPSAEAAKAVEKRSAMAYDALQRVVSQRPVLINRAPTMHKYSIMAARPRLVKGETLQIPPAITAPFTADFDGDLMSYTVPVSQAAVQEAFDRMLPEKNLRSARNDAINYKPTQEFLLGLYLSTKDPARRPIQRFASVEEAKEAYRKGLLRVDDPIRIEG